MKHLVRIAHVKNCHEMCINSVQRQFIQYSFYPNQLHAGDVLKKTCMSHKRHPEAFFTIPFIVLTLVPPNLYDVFLRPCS